jgi:hypothetical protein
MSSSEEDTNPDTETSCWTARVNFLSLGLSSELVLLFCEDYIESFFPRSQIARDKSSNQHPIVRDVIFSLRIDRESMQMVEHQMIHYSERKKKQ